MIGAVLGLGQCLNYLSNVNCRLCYAESKVKLPFCLPATSAHLYLNGCFLRYGNHNFSQESVSESDSSICGSSKKVADENKFKEIANGLIQNLTLGASLSSDDKVFNSGCFIRLKNVSGLSRLKIMCLGVLRERESD